MKSFSYLFAFAALLFGAVSMASAQEVTSTTEETNSEEITNHRRYEVGTFNDNWSIGAGGGVNVYFGENDGVMKFGHRLAPAAELYVAKWFTPAFGMRIHFGGLQAKGLTHQIKSDYFGPGPINSTGEVYDAGQKVEVQRIGYYAAHADFLLNFVNLFGGYKQRVYNISGYFGIGVAHSAPHASVVTNPVSNTRLSGRLGLLNTFRLCDALDLNIDIRGNLVPQDFEGEVWKRKNGLEFRESDGIASATIGLAYKFNPRGWVQGKTIYKTRTMTTKIVDDAALAALKADNEALQRALASAEANAVENVIRELHHMPGYLVTFDINKSKIQNKDRVNLGKIAEALKDTDDSVILLLTGYADEGTGTVKINERLSRERAGAVYNCLVNEFGIKPEKLETDYKGGVENMFYDDAILSRSVVISIKK